MAIIINNLTHVYNKKTDIETSALNNISLKLKDHFFTAIIGKTGSGKTTFLQHLNGLLIPNDGEVILDDFKITSNYKKSKKNIVEIRKKVGYLFQFSENQLFENTVLDDVMFAPLNFKIEKEEAKKLAIESLKLVNLNENLYEKSPLNLSGGEKRRAALAGILALKPKYLLLDEPTSGLDVSGKNDLINLLKKLYESGVSILLVTHDMDLVLNCCNDVILMDKGKVIDFNDVYSVFKRDDLENYGIVKPKIFEFCSDFERFIDINKVKNIDDFIVELKKNGK